MKIDHLALWVTDLEEMKNFYEKYFEATAGPRYTNSKNQFQSYFLSFKGSPTRLELMHRASLNSNKVVSAGLEQGLAHFAISVGSKDRVNQLTERLRNENFTVAGEPRTTGDGYYESVVLDPEGNYLEITI